MAQPIDYQKQFAKQAISYLPHHALLRSVAMIKNKPLLKLLNNVAQGSSFQVKSYPSKDVEAYLETSTGTKLWHGTGRFQYSDTKIIDVLDLIVLSGSLNPQDDVYAIALGKGRMKTISTTKLRIIARSYADTHGDGELEKNRFGGSLWWVSYYYSFFYAKAFSMQGLTLARNWKEWSNAATNSNGERTWGKKVNKSAKSVWDVFGLGSDEPANYPILFGIKSHGELVDLPKSIARVESRIVEPVKLSDLSHIEVPEEKIQEVQHLLDTARYTVPVFPIELGEFVASKKSIEELLGYSQ